MNNNAQNVANVNSDRYIPRETTISETQNGGTKANTAAATDNGSQRSQTDLAKELTDQVTIQNVSEANARSIRAQDEMRGSLLDIKA
jgi:flagellar hook protein FlgE